MTEPKISLTLILPGSVMVSQQDAENNPKLNEYKTIVLRDGKKEKPYNYTIRKTISAKQVIKLSDIAYNYMLETPISSKYYKTISILKGKPVRIWDSMSVKDKINAYCATIAKNFNAESYSFIILDD